VWCATSAITLNKAGVWCATSAITLNKVGVWCATSAIILNKVGVWCATSVARTTEHILFSETKNLHRRAARVLLPFSEHLSD
jgi:hypothetical protein